MEYYPQHDVPEGQPDADKAALLERFRGPIAARDAEVIERWRQASPADHARAMIDLADMAERIVASTGFRKNPAEQFPGFPTEGGRSSAT